MRFTMLVAMLVLVLPPVASAQEVMSIRSAHAGPLLRSGVVAVQRLSFEQDRVAAAQLQQTKLNHDKKTTIILIAVIAVAAVVWFAVEFDGVY